MPDLRDLLGLPQRSSPLGQTLLKHQVASQSLEIWTRNAMLFYVILGVFNYNTVIYHYHTAVKLQSLNSSALLEPDTP